jgi:3-deoxy-D-manno-octulosonic-acid transferase
VTTVGLGWVLYDAIWALPIAAWLVGRLVVSPWKGLDALREGLGSVPLRPATARRALWVHAVSVGELASARPVLAELKRRHPDWWILLTVIQRHAYRLARQAPTGADAVARLPWDAGPCLERALGRARPDVLVLVECELWPSLIVRTAARGARVTMMNARIYEASFPWYRRARRVFAAVVRAIAFIGAQSEADRRRFLALGAPAERVVVHGSTKFDAGLPRDWERRLAELRRLLPPGGPVWVLASTHDNEEEQILARVAGLRERFPGLVLVIAPRHVSRARRVHATAEAQGLRTARRSRLTEGAGTLDVVVLDTMGELGVAMGAADLVFVGGSLVDRGGHNPIEPALHGKAILIGPSVHAFADVVAAFAAEAALRRVADAGELIRCAAELLGDREARDEMGRRALGVVARHAGAAVTYATLIERYADGPGTT